MRQLASIQLEVRGVGTDERSRNRFRSGLYAAARLDKVSVRGLPDGSVRVTKVREWSSVRVYEVCVLVTILLLFSGIIPRVLAAVDFVNHRRTSSQQS